MSDDNVIGLPAEPPEPFVTREQLAHVMGVSTRTIDRMVAQGMPSVTWGRRTRRFRASTAIAWAQSQQGGKIAS